MSATTTNQAATILNEVIGILMTGGEKAAEIYLTALDPGLLAIPIIAWLMDEGIEWLGQIVSIAGQKTIDGIVIDVQKNGEQSQAVTAATALILANGSGNADGITQATTALEAAYKSAINYDGWATPK